MPLKSFLLAWLHILLLHSSDAVLEELPRKSCPPMDGAKQSTTNRADTSDRIRKLRDAMLGLQKGSTPNDAYIITRYDEHLNDFDVADHDKRLKYITGYTGNNGLAVVTKTKLAFWIDELHYEQADNELSCNWTLFKTADTGSSTAALCEWLLRELPANSRVGADAKTMSNTEWETISRAVYTPAKSLIFTSVLNNSVDLIWPEKDRPRTTNYDPYIWPEKYAGRSWKDKLASLRERLKSLDVDAMVVTSLSEIAWLLNIRGNALPYGPFLKAFVIVSKDQLRLYTDAALPDPIQQYLYTSSCASEYCVRLHAYEDVYNDIRKSPIHWKKILFPSTSHFSNGANRNFCIQVHQDRRKLMQSPIIPMMAEKTAAEIENMKSAHTRDAVMFCNFSTFLDYAMQTSSENWDELFLVNLIKDFRTSESLFKGLSYPIRVATGMHTGIYDYIPTKETSMMVERSALLVIDSGSHYWDGTTALARTFFLDKDYLGAREVELYTRLLMGLINFAMLSFPPHITTSQLDLIPRTSLWDVGYDYPHGSGHGIGVCSHVYESPIDINYRNGMNDTLKPGNLLLAEVGLYAPTEPTDGFGMKLSMVLAVIEKKDNSGYLSFEPVTMFPFETRMINQTLLSPQQKDWLNEYNGLVRSVVGSVLLKMNNANNAYNWLIDRTEPEKIEETEGGAIVETANVYLNFLLMITFIVRFIMNA